MIDLEPTDLADLDTFELRWRWMSERHWLAPPSALERIRPLTPEKARELWAVTQAAIQCASDWQQAERFPFDGGDAARWLGDRLGSETVQLVVFWYDHLAVATDAELFTS